MGSSSRADTIVAVSSGPGASARGIVRLSGALSFALVAERFDALEARPGERRAVSGAFRLASGAALPAHLLFFPGPRSATGEDVAEVHTLGSPPLLAEIVRDATRRGARLALPGEFTRRAYLAGRIDLLQAEAVADLVSAETAAEAARAAPALRGRLGERIEKMKSDLLDATARVEARLDFTDDDIPDLEPEEVAAAVEGALVETARLLGVASLRVAPGDEPVVALVGAPNAGKSTLFNALLAEERVVVSPEAGTTRDAVSARAEMAGRRVLLVDTAGLGAGETGGEIDALARERTSHAIDAARLVVLLLDGSRPPSPDERRLFLERAIAGAALVVRSKSDLASDVRAKSLLDSAAARRHPGREALELSAARGVGLESLRAAIAGELDSADRRAIASAPPGSIVAARQREAIRSARGALRRARVHLRRRSGERERNYELLAADLRDAASALGSLTGAVATDDILDRIFSRFCIGK